MPFLNITKVLDNATGVKKDGAAYLISEETEAQIFIAMGNEVLQIPRLARVEATVEIVTLQTHKSERFFFPPEQIVGLKLGGNDSRKHGSHAGFFKS